MQIEYINSSERFGMCGPWIGKLRIDNVELNHEFLDDNFTSSNDKILYAFNLFINNKKKTKSFFGLFEAQSSDRIFQILVYNTSKDKWYISKDSWDALFITRISDGKIFYTNAFHDKDRKQFPEKLISFNSDTFIEVNAKDIKNNNLTE